MLVAHVLDEARKWRWLLHLAYSLSLLIFGLVPLSIRAKGIGHCALYRSMTLHGREMRKFDARRRWRTRLYSLIFAVALVEGFDHVARSSVLSR